MYMYEALQNLNLNIVVEGANALMLDIDFGEKLNIKCSKQLAFLESYLNHFVTDGFCLLQVHIHL